MGGRATGGVRACVLCGKGEYIIHVMRDSATAVSAGVNTLKSTSPCSSRIAGKGGDVKQYSDAVQGQVAEQQGPVTPEG